MSKSGGPFDKRLVTLVPSARKPLVLLAALGVIQGGLAIGVAVAVTNLVVQVIAQGRLVIPIASLVAVMAARGVASWLAETVSARLAALVSRELRRSLTTRWLSAPSEQAIEPATRAALASQGVTAIEPYVTKYLPALIAGVVTPVLALLALLWVDPISALIVLLTLPLLPFFAALIGMATERETQRRWQRLADLSGHFSDVMKGLPTLVNYGRAERQTEVIAQVNGAHRRATMRTLRLAFMSSAALELLASLSVAIVAVTVGLRLTYGSMELFAGLLAILLAPEAYWPIRKVGAEFHAAADGVQALDDVANELVSDDVDPKAEDAESSQSAHLIDPGGAAVSMQGVTYRYPAAANEVIGGFAASWDRGLHTVTGISGAGKTTLLEIIAGLRTANTGVVISGDVHFVTGRPYLPAGTLRNALTLGNEASDAAIWEALQDVDLERWAHGLPSELDTAFGEDGFGMSAGQRARIVLARAALSDTSVILLDEPTAHLDPTATAQVHEALLRLASSRCVIAVTHQSALMAIADTQRELLAAT